MEKAIEQVELLIEIGKNLPMRIFQQKALTDTQTLSALNGWLGKLELKA